MRVADMKKARYALILSCIDTDKNTRAFYTYEVISDDIKNIMDAAENYMKEYGSGIWDVVQVANDYSDDNTLEGVMARWEDVGRSVACDNANTYYLEVVSLADCNLNGYGVVFVA